MRRPRPTRELSHQERKKANFSYEHPFFSKRFKTHILHGQPSKLAEYYIYGQYLGLVLLTCVIRLRLAHPHSGTCVM